MSWIAVIYYVFVDGSIQANKAVRNLSFPLGKAKNSIYTD